MTQGLRVVENPDERTWDDFVAAHGGHLLQSSAWGALKSRFGWNALRLALADGDKLIAGAQVLFLQLPLGLMLAYLPRGPVCDPNDNNTVTMLLDAVCAAAKLHGAFALKLEPNIFAPYSVCEGMAKIDGYDSRNSDSIQPRTTIHLDLTRNLDAILAQMKPKWRYNIRLAERKGVIVRQGNSGDMATFHGLMQITGARDHFAIHSLDYYRAAFELLAPNERACLLIAEHGNEPLAALIVTAFGGEAIYLYGASSNVQRDRMPNHALHWAAIQWAKARGCARYDLWGIPEKAEGERTLSSSHVRPSSLPDGLQQFKQGFGGQPVRYIDARDIIFSRVRYAPYAKALAWRRAWSGRSKRAAL
jgi:peptidoglycan pentaglycine glycine transferase (the first glycine)